MKSIEKLQQKLGTTGQWWHCLLFAGSVCFKVPPWIGNAQNASKCSIFPAPTLFACHVVGRKVRWMVRVVILHEEEFPDGHGTQGQHGGAQLSQRFPVQNHTPQMNAIPRNQVTSVMETKRKAQRMCPTSNRLSKNFMYLPPSPGMRRSTCQSKSWDCLTLKNNHTTT